MPIDLSSVVGPSETAESTNAGPIAHTKISPNDEYLLIRALKTSIDNAQTYKQAMEGLHGVHGYPAHLWKDHYLEHGRRIDLQLPDPVPRFVKKPTAFRMATEQSDYQPVSASNTFMAPGSRSMRKWKPYARPTFYDDASTLTAVAVETPAPNSDSSSSSRSPSPPAAEIRYTSVNRKAYTFSEQDRIFFFKQIRWALSRDSSLTKRALCDQIHEKAPHHSATSWAYFWGKEAATADRILSAAQTKPIRYEEILENSLPSSSIANNDDDEYVDDSSKDATSGFIDAYSMAEPPGGDEAAMGQSAGDSYTDADDRVMARYVTTIKNFDLLTPRQQWSPFAQKYPQRGCGSWVKRYTRKKACASCLSLLPRTFYPSSECQTDIDHFAKLHEKQNIT